MTSDTYKFYPNSYPDDLLARIIEDGATQQYCKDVYRISKTGACNRDVFICSALENEVGEVNTRDAYLAEKNRAYEIGEWSTSCCDCLSAAQEKLALMERHHDRPLILIGNILPETGYSVLTTERKTIKILPAKKLRKKKHHIDWWIFKDQDVSEHFRILEV